MSYIISAGSKKPQWVPEGKAKKVAQIDGAIDGAVEAAPQEEENPFFNAIKGLDSVKEQASSLEQAIETATEAVEAVKEVALSEGVIQPKSVGEAPVVAPDVAAVAIEAPKVEEKIEEAPKVEEAPKAEEKKEGNPFEEKKEEAPKSEEVSEAKPEEKKEVDEVEIEIPGVVEEKAGEVEKEGCGMSCGASSNDKLIALAKLSPENRKDLGKFWKDDLGMPAEWVDAMLKDY